MYFILSTLTIEAIFFAIFTFLLDASLFKVSVSPSKSLAHFAIGLLHKRSPSESTLEDFPLSLKLISLPLRLLGCVPYAPSWPQLYLSSLLQLRKPVPNIQTVPNCALLSASLDCLFCSNLQ
jgi:hypothetical protein